MAFDKAVAEIKWYDKDHAMGSLLEDVFKKTVEERSK